MYATLNITCVVFQDHMEMTPPTHPAVSGHAHTMSTIASAADYPLPTTGDPAYSKLPVPGHTPNHTPTLMNHTPVSAGEMMSGISGNDTASGSHPALM